MELFCKLQKTPKVIHAHCIKIRKYTWTKRKKEKSPMMLTLELTVVTTFFQTPVQVHDLWNLFLSHPLESPEFPLFPIPCACAD